MKVIRDEDKNSNKYIINFKISHNKKKKNTSVGDDTIKITTEDYSDIVVNMADGSKPRYANIEENKVRLLGLMKEQHLRNRNELEDLREKNRFFKVASVASIILTVICIITTQTLNLDIEYMAIQNILEVILPTASLGCYATSIFEMIKAHNQIKEIKKNDYLIENEQVLNSADLNNANTLEKIAKKDKNEIFEIKEEKDKNNDKQYFDINNIDGLSLDALKQLKSNIERENYLGLVPSNDDKTYEKKKIS